MKYSDKLRDPRWQKKRLEILEAAAFTCEDCGNKENELQVHHCFYAKGREPWEYNRNSLICVCVDCHLRREGIEFTIKSSLAAVCRFSSVPTLENIAPFLCNTATGMDGFVSYNSHVEHPETIL